MRELNPEDLKYIVKKLPKDLVFRMQRKPNKYFIAGGFIRSCIAHEKINDIDVFAANASDAKELTESLQPDETKVFTTENAYSFTLEGKSVQIIHKWTFTSPQDIINHFDFTIAQAVIYLYDKDGKELHTKETRYEWKSICVDNYYEDLAAKRLIYTYPLNPEAGASLLRVLKFKSRGYNPTLKSLAQIVDNLVKDKPEEHDTYYHVIKKLVEVDPLAAPVNVTDEP